MASIGAVVVTALLLGTALAGPARASVGDMEQVLPLRQQTPVVAGSQLTFPGGRCTAGAVLYRTNLVGRITQFQRATRYVVTAKHCGGVGTQVFVGGDLLGAVTFVADDLDYSVITVPPSSTSARRCSVLGSTPACFDVVTYHPRAFGRVLVGGHGLAFAAPVSVPGYREPAGREDFCTSGAITGWLCGFRAASFPPDGHPGADRAAANYGGNIARGDSGGPVLDREGRLLGITQGFGRPGTAYANVMLYVSMTSILRQLASYALAQD
jgi:hypothetical protein